MRNRGMDDDSVSLPPEFMTAVMNSGIRGSNRLGALLTHANSGLFPVYAGPSWD